MYLLTYFSTCHHPVQYQTSNFPLDARTGLQSIQSTNALFPMSRMMNFRRRVNLFRGDEIVA